MVRADPGCKASYLGRPLPENETTDRLDGASQWPANGLRRLPALRYCSSNEET